jgi:hypothetical protein
MFFLGTVLCVVFDIFSQHVLYVLFPVLTDHVALILLEFLRHYGYTSIFPLLCFPELSPMQKSRQPQGHTGF